MIDLAPGRRSSSSADPNEYAQQLDRLELVIEHGFQSFLDVGEALLQIRDGALYRAHGYRSFSQYLYERWHLTRRRAYQLERLPG